MNSRGASTGPLRLLCSLLLLSGAALAPQLPAAQPDSYGTVSRAVTATPPLQVVPASSGSKSVQQRMRGCNTAADSRKLAGAARETFIKSCMAPRRSRSLSRPGSQPQPNP